LFRPVSRARIILKFIKTIENRFIAAQRRYISHETCFAPLAQNQRAQHAPFKLNLLI
jgi:hypothetical protein